MTLAIDTVDGCGLSNEAYHKVLSKKSKVMLYYLQGINQLYITNKTECLSYESDHPMQVVKLLIKIRLAYSVTVKIYFYH